MKKNTNTINRFWFYGTIDKVIKRELVTMASKLGIPATVHTEYTHFHQSVACVEVSYEVDDDGTISDMWSDDTIKIDKDGLYDRYKSFAGIHTRNKLIAKAVIRQCLRHELRHMYQAMEKEQVGLNISELQTEGCYGDISWEKDANIYAWKEADRKEKQIAYHLLLEQCAIKELDAETLINKKKEMYISKRNIQKTYISKVIWSYRATIKTTAGLTSDIGEKEDDMMTTERNITEMSTWTGIKTLVKGTIKSKLFKKYTDDDTMASALIPVMNVIAKRVCKKEFTFNDYKMMFDAMESIFTDTASMQDEEYRELANIITRDTGINTVITNNPLMIVAVGGNPVGGSVVTIQHDYSKELTVDNTTALIFVYRDWFNDYTRLTRKAICLHEVGHVVNQINGIDKRYGSIWNHIPFGKATMPELMADAYATSAMGKEVMINMFEEIKDKMSKLSKIVFHSEIESRIDAIKSVNSCGAKRSPLSKAISAMTLVTWGVSAYRVLSARFFLTDEKITELMEIVMTDNKKILENDLDIEIKGIERQDRKEYVMSTGYTYTESFMSITNIEPIGIIEYSVKNLRSSLMSLSFLVSIDKRVEFFETIIKAFICHEARHIYQFTYRTLKFSKNSNFKFSLDFGTLFAKSYGEIPEEADANDYSVFCALTAKEQSVFETVRMLQGKYNVIDVIKNFFSILKAWR